MVVFQPATMAGRATLRRLACQLSQISSSPAAATSSTSTAAFVCRPYHTQIARSSGLPFSTSSSTSTSSLSADRARQHISPLHHAASVLTRSLRRSNSTTTTTKKTTSTPKVQAAAASTIAAGRTLPTTDNDAAPKKSFFPETNSKSVAYWLLGSAASVFGIVVFGGLTRLTESGLSITEWRPVTGSVPPTSPEDWESEFAKYRASPEYALLNPHMDLDEFKKIYFMEWTHRLWGRLIGVTFVLPTLYFIARRRVTRRTAAHLLGISALIGFQGVIGWWMVASGLTDDLFAAGSHPRVSQYRLAAHLGTAFVCYSWMLLAGLSVLRARRLLAAPDPAGTVRRLAGQLAHPAVRSFRRCATALTALVFVTALSGAFVAGLDAGLIYNEFPMMGLGLTPPRSELWDRFYCRREDGSDLWWRNMLENPSLVQLDHRIMATAVCAGVLALVAYSRTGRVRAALPPDARKATMGVLHLMIAQVTLGITTLIYIVPTHLAATHQAGALALLTGALVLGSRLRIPRGTLRLANRLSKPVQSK